MQSSGKKIAAGGFIDFSDYGRTLGIAIAKVFVNTRVKAYYITLVHFAFMLLAVYSIAAGNILAGTVLLLIKNVLDGADGSLARMQDRPSRVGRFLDSNLDFIGNFCLFLFLPGPLLNQKILIFLSFIFQGTFYNYYFILFRVNYKGESTSKIKESGGSGYSYDNPKAVKILFWFYRVFYAWQDAITEFIETKLLKSKHSIPSNLWMSLLSINGLGFQYLAVIVCLLLKTPTLAGVYFVYIMNAFMIIMLTTRALNAKNI